MSIIKLVKNWVLKYFLYFIIFLLVILIIEKYFISYINFAEFGPIISDITDILNFNLLWFLNINLSLINLLSFVFVIILWFSIWKYYKKFIHTIKKSNNNMTTATVTILSNIGYYVILTIFILSSLKLVWIDLSNLTMIISALSVGLWFGLQTIVSNFISGIILMFEQSIKVGDFIELWTDLRGTVVNINMRSTTIRTNDNIDIVVPNKNFIENNIVNWTLSDRTVRIKIPFWVAYWTTFENVQEIVLWALEKSEIDYLKTQDKKPFIVMSGMWASSVDFSLFVWVKWDDTNIPLVAKWAFVKMIYKALNDNNISIPFPQMDLHIKSSIPFKSNN